MFRFTNMKINHKKIIFYVTLTAVFALLSYMYVTLFSYSTSKWYPDFYGNDSAHFLTVGKCWAFGKIPYKDLFDHKGPLIFFIDMVGFMLGGMDKSAISVIQTVFMVFTLWGIYKISQLATKKMAYGIIAVLLSLIAMNFNYMEGNSVEEYCLPFLTWSLYGILKYFQENHIEHSWKWAFLYGITAGVSLLTRLTNVVPICAGILVICIILIKNKKIKNFAVNALAVIVGMLIVTLPFILYFGFQGCLWTAYYDVFVFSILYSQKIGAWYKTADLNTVIMFGKLFFLFYIIFLAALIRFLKKEYKLASMFFLMGLFESIYFMNMQCWGQYALICLPQFVILLNEVISIIKDKNEFLRIVAYLNAGLLTLFLGLSMIQSVPQYANYKRNYSEHRERQWEKLAESVPENERDVFITCGGNEFKEFYIIMDIIPCYKYYMIQDFHWGFDPNIQKGIIEDFSSGYAKWILTDKHAECIQSILSEQYELVDHSGDYSLYKRIDTDNR